MQLKSLLYYWIYDWNGYSRSAFIALFKLSLSIVGAILVFYIYFKLIEKRIIKKLFGLLFKSFFLRHKKIIIYIFLIISLYRIADIVMEVVTNLFYSDLGYSLIEIASYSKFWGFLLKSTWL